MVSDETKEVVKTVVFGSLAIIGFGVSGLTAHSGVTAYQDYQSDKTAVDGKIISSEVEYDTSGRGGSYDAEIQYEYTYNGQTYRNDNLKPGTGIADVTESQARAIVSQYPANETTTVYVNTDSPSASWLQDELPVGHIGFMGIFTLAGLGFAANMVRTARS